MGLVLTPQAFFDLFILCLSWQWNPESLLTSYTTVDKTVRILHGLGLVTDKQKRLLAKDRRTQYIFLRQSRIIFSGIREIVKEKRNLPPQKILDLKEYTVIMQPGDTVTENINRERMLHDYRIHLTYRGKAYAEDIYPKYKEFLTQEKYFAEIERQGYPDDAAMGAIMTRYRAKMGLIPQSEE